MVPHVPNIPSILTPPLAGVLASLCWKPTDPVWLTALCWDPGRTFKHCDSCILGHLGRWRTSQNVGVIKGKSM